MVTSRCLRAVPGQKRRLPDHTGKFSQAAAGGHRDDPAARYFVTARSAAATATSRTGPISDSCIGGKNASDTGLDGAFTTRTKRTADT